jgi:hypothetical protein
MSLMHTVLAGVSRAFGLPFGAAVWLGAHIVAVPALGLHLVYGSITELVRRV